MRVAQRMYLARTALLITVLCMITSPLAAGPDSYRIDLPARTFFPVADHAAYLGSLSKAESTSTVLLQFERHPNTSAKRALARDGVVLQFYVGGGAWVASIARDANLGTLSAYAPRWAGPLLPEDRIAPALSRANTPTWANTGDGTRLYAVRFASTVPEDEAEALLWRVAEEVGDYVAPLHTWYIRALPEAPDQLAGEQGVLYISYIAMPLQTNNASVRTTMHVDEVQVHPYYLDGSGVVACVYDGGLVDYTHPDFGGRVIAGEGGGFADHSTHVAGTLGGGGDTSVRGMAPGVSILSFAYEECDPYCLYNSPQDMWENYTDAVMNGDARLITNSIGANISTNGYDCDWLGDYELYSSLVDSVVRGGVGREVVILFSAGNERQGEALCGDSFGTLSVPAGAKNVITVGAVNDAANIADFSSLGPTDDGRIKPEVVGDGVGVRSTITGGEYDVYDGTSMSTPATAGVVALMMEAWSRHPNLDPPTPAQIKALLVTGATDQGMAGPDYTYGFGLVDAQATVDIVNRYGFEAGEVDDGGQWSHDFAVVSGTADLKVSIAWADPPAAPLAAQTLVNDLDLTLVSPTGTTYQPYCLDPDLPANLAVVGRNSIDVVEQVYVAEPETGLWQIVVDGYDVPIGPQTFGVASTVSLREGVVTVAGVVLDSLSGEGIEGALVHPEGMSVGATTDMNGGFSFRELMPGDGLFFCTAEGYEPQRGYLIHDTETDSYTLDFSMLPGSLVEVMGVVFDSEGVAVSGAWIFLDDANSPSAASDDVGVFSLNLQRGRVYTIRAQNEGLVDEIETYVPSTGAPEQVEFTLQDQVPLPTGPDNRGYMAIQNGDNHPLAPTYNWLEIDPDQGGLGTRIETLSEETPQGIELPFTFIYYGVSYDTITINENGFFFFGPQGNVSNEVAGDFSNSEIPGVDGPPAMVAPFWEDFRAAETHLSTYYDETNDLFYVEWYDSRQWPTDATRETFQVVLYDPAVHSAESNDGMLLFQYADVNDLANATVGIESPDERSGIQLLNYDTEGVGTTEPTIGQIAENSAILFVRNLATFQGTVFLHPENASVEPFVVYNGAEIPCDAAGAFQLVDLPYDRQLIEVKADGYETLTIMVDLSEGSAEPVSVDLYGLLPPTGITAEDGETGFLITWTPPHIDETPLTSFLDRYRVYRDGQFLTEVEATSYLDRGPYTPETVFWVTSVYSGGESDTTIHLSPETSMDVREGALPTSFEVSAAWPNPFNPSTTIQIALPESRSLRVEVVDLLGRRVALLADAPRVAPGLHRITWNGSGQASGLYFLRVDAGAATVVRRVMLLK